MYDCTTCSLYNSWKVDDILKWPGTNVMYHKTICKAHFWPRSFKAKIKLIGTKFLVQSECIEPLLGFKKSSYKHSTGFQLISCFVKLVCLAHVWPRSALVSCLWSHLPVQKLFPFGDIWGRHDCFYFWKHLSSFVLLVPCRCLHRRGL